MTELQKHDGWQDDQTRNDLGGAERSPLGRSDDPPRSFAPPPQGQDLQAPSDGTPSAGGNPYPAGDAFGPDDLPLSGRPPAAEEDPLEADGEPIGDTEPPPLHEPPLRMPRLSGRSKGAQHLARDPMAEKVSKLTAEQRLLALDTWRRSGLPAGDQGGHGHGAGRRQPSLCERRRARG